MFCEKMSHLVNHSSPFYHKFRWVLQNGSNSPIQWVGGNCYFQSELVVWYYHIRYMTARKKICCLTGNMVLPVKNHAINLMTLWYQPSRLSESWSSFLFLEKIFQSCCETVKRTKHLRIVCLSVCLSFLVFRCSFWSWMDGTPVNYVAWAPHEPNFANNDENCVVMYKTTGLTIDFTLYIEWFYLFIQFTVFLFVTSCPKVANEIYEKHTSIKIEFKNLE